jgi:hypothetical protein
MIDYIRIGIEAALPQAVAEDGDRMRAGRLIFVGGKEGSLVYLCKDALSTFPDQGMAGEPVYHD